uniref:Ribonuclease P/MRP 25 subunit-like n=1 Tax=Oryzias sinensis TaxID=183150 RepID=A0A8C7X4H1_9TELE
MENYSRARSVEQPSICPFAGLAADTPELRVKDGSKIRNLLRFALSRMEAKPRGGEEDEGGQRAHAACPQMVFTASGKAVSKAITCAEIVKRRVKGLHQVTRLLHSTVVEVWEPLEPAAGLDSLNVSRKLPAVWILLSREPLDSSQPGYQAPGFHHVGRSPCSPRDTEMFRLRCLGADLLSQKVLVSLRSAGDPAPSDRVADPFIS